MNAKHEQVTAHTLDGLWQSMSNSGKHGDWIRTIRAAANQMRDLEKRNRELEAVVVEYIDADTADTNAYVSQKIDQCSCGTCERARALLTPAKPEAK